jgi:8-oxo-dGTP diphosphatase
VSAPTRIRNAGKALIVRDGKLLTTVNRGDDVFYLLPGGGQEPGESLPECVRREVREEIGVEVEVGDLRFVRDYIGARHDRTEQESGVHALELMFECRLLTEPVDGGAAPDIYQIGIEWLPLDRIEEYNFRPHALRPHLRAWGESAAPVYVGDVN